MRSASDDIQKARVAGSPEWGMTGGFNFVNPDTGRRLYVHATDGEWTANSPYPRDHPLHRWEHVSVSLERSPSSHMTPTWAEMCFVKDLFWTPDEWVVQYHPAAADYVNHHPGVLHLWRYKGEMPTPPTVAV